jgi:hypothetical protein
MRSRTCSSATCSPDRGPAWPAVCVLVRDMKAMIAAIRFLVLAAAGCQTAAITPSDGGFPATDAADQVDGLACNSVSAAGPPVHIGCPVGHDCRDCPPGAAPGPIPGGRYLATQTTLYASGCGIFQDMPGTLVIEVKGATVNVLSELPVLSGGRTTLSFAVTGDQITFTQICPPVAPHGPAPGAYLVWPDHLFFQNLEGTPGPTVFVRL